jgi:Ni,Fe-hydrogenase I cytochrome b subunit
MNNTISNEKKENKIPFLYALKIKTAIYGFVLYTLLSSITSFKVLNLIFKNIFNNSVELLNDKNELSFLGRIIMAVIIAFVLFTF